MIRARFYYQCFQFKNPSGTSRGILTEKHAWFIELSEGKNTGIGECSVIPGLSPDFENHTSYESKLNKTIAEVNSGTITLENCASKLIEFPSILFGIETAFLDLIHGGKRMIFDNDFAHGKSKIAINGLIWMGTETFMHQQIEQKLADGYSTIKMKVGAIDFETEYMLLQSIRSNYSSKEVILRVDANGAFNELSAPKILAKLANLDIHSIEQPINPGQWQAMRNLCSTTPTPIALDEELIGINSILQKIELLDTIQPQFIILKPSLHGGIHGCKEWISLAEERNIPWWMTSALESNIGLNAICQFTAEYKNDLPQGLGTGSLYTNNIDSDLTVRKGFIFKKITV